MFNSAKSAAKVAPTFARTLPRLQIPAFDHVPQKYEGPSYETIDKYRKEHISTSTFLYYRQTPMITEGKMQYLFDHTGRRYLDLFAGIATTGQGHSHPRITGKVIEQAEKLQHVSTIY